MMAVGEVSAMGEMEPEDRVARLEHGGVGGHVGLGPGMRLHVGVLAPNSFWRVHGASSSTTSVNSQAAVVALARIALGVFVS